MIYTIAAAYAGAAGALLAQTTQFVSLDVLAFHRSADLMLVLIIGGIGYLYGGIIGAVMFKLLQDWIAALTPQYWQFWIGLLLVLFVLGGREILHGSLAPSDGVAEAVHKQSAAVMTIVLRTTSLCKTFGGITATDHVSLRP